MLRLVVVHQVTVCPCRLARIGRSIRLRRGEGQFPREHSTFERGNSSKEPTPQPRRNQEVTNKSRDTPNPQVLRFPPFAEHGVMRLVGRGLVYCCSHASGLIWPRLE